MALSMDEQRVLAEIERRLVSEEPGLATCLTTFRRPGPAMMLKSPRARILGSLFTVAVVAMISLMVYAMIPFRTHVPRAPAGRSGPAATALTAAPSNTGKTVITAPPRQHASGPASTTSNSTASKASPAGK